MPYVDLGYFQQGQDRQWELDNLGAKLSKVLDCPIHYPVFNKNLFGCKHGITFPVFMVKAAYETGNWDQIIRQHVVSMRKHD